MVTFSKTRISLNVNPCPKCGSNKTKIFTAYRNNYAPNNLFPACVRCLDCGFTCGEPREKDSIVGMFFNPEYAIKAWNNEENF
ncbi:MAG: hypothetical protein IJP96_12370 [Synergistaceae bacterium]|nr:hypothetical protein [Synergistaceae bacterium]